MRPRPGRPGRDAGARIQAGAAAPRARSSRYRPALNPIAAGLPTAGAGDSGDAVAGRAAGRQQAAQQAADDVASSPGRQPGTSVAPLSSSRRPARPGRRARRPGRRPLTASQGTGRPVPGERPGAAACPRGPEVPAIAGSQHQRWGAAVARKMQILPTDDTGSSAAAGTAPLRAEHHRVRERAQGLGHRSQRPRTKPAGSAATFKAAISQ